MTVAGGCLVACRTGDPHIFDCIMTEMLFSYVGLMKPGPQIVFWAQTGATPWPAFQSTRTWGKVVSLGQES